MKKNNISKFLYLLPVIILSVAAIVISLIPEVEENTAISIALSLVSLALAMTNALIGPKSADNRWLINKEVECFENIIDSCEYYKITIEEYEHNRIDVEFLVGIHRIELLKTLIESKRSIENYRNYLTGYDRSEEIFKKLSDLIDDVINCTDDYEKTKKYLEEIIKFSYQLINLSPYIYSEIHKKEIKNKNQEMLEKCDCLKKSNSC